MRLRVVFGCVDGVHHGGCMHGSIVSTLPSVCGNCCSRFSKFERCRPVSHCCGCECMVKKLKSLWRKVDILVSGLWERETWKPRSANFLKSCRDAASATMFSSEGIQNAKISMSNTAAM